MIIIKNVKKYSVYCRTNKKIKWRYSTFAGCYDSIEEAIEEIKKHFPNQYVQYNAEDMDTGEEIIGEIK